MTARYRSELSKIGKIQAENQIIETVITRKDGARVPIELSLSIRKTGDSYVATSIVRDITERKLAEEKMRESEEFSKSLLENAPNPIEVINLDTSTRYVNKAFEDLTGFTSAEIVGRKTPYPWWPDEFKKELGGAIEKDLADGNIRRKETIFQNKKGERLWAELSIVPVKHDGATAYLLVNWVDITERKIMEETLRYSDTVLKSLREGVFTTDNEFKITRWNEMCEQIFGIKASDAIGKTTSDIITLVEEYQGQNKERINLLVEKGFYKEEQLYRTPHGDIWVDVHAQAIEENGKRQGWISLISDISARKQAEEALKQSEGKYRELINTSNDGILSTDAQMKFIVWNHGAERLFGYSENEILGQSMLKIIPEKLLKRVTSEFQLSQSGASLIANTVVETEGLKKDGSEVPLEISVSMRKTGEGYITTFITRDISERKEAEEKLRKIDQMKSEFLSNVSHELRTPLQSISGFTKLIMNGQVPDPATQQEFFQIIDRETMHLGNLINSLLDMSRLEAGRFQIYKKLTPIRETFIDSLKMFHSLARDKNITLTEDIPPQMPEMEVDGERMRQVVINLVGNAIKFSDPGGSVAVKVEKQESDLLFQVSDHGIGIHEEAMKHLFERFYRAEGETVRGGTGLGLYISKQIIDAHGGRIWAESKFGEGSTFSFTLPLNGKGGNRNGKENTGH